MGHDGLFRNHAGTVALAKDRELPPIFAKLNRFGMPSLALIIATLLPILVIIVEKDIVHLAALYAIGVVGAIAGKQIGGGRGRTAMSVLGAVGGAFAGNAIEKDVRKVKSYDITIRFEDGSIRTLSQATQPVWRGGDRVRLINGAIQPNA